MFMAARHRPSLSFLLTSFLSYSPASLTLISMTVASLWKVLDQAGSGRPVGLKEFSHIDMPRGGMGQDGRREKPSNFNDAQAARNTKNRRMSLAIDLSIWICESLMSQALKENHANPPLRLVFARTVKLLSLGVKLIFVVEGKRRIRGDNGESDKFHRRRRGTSFWKACEECQQMLLLLGVPVVKAKAEGEALCALLCIKGLVDGVISNDGDCLLFGAPTIYTKFSIENLENDKVMRYDLNNLKANIEPVDERNSSENRSEAISLSRSDLVTFAILTGSDMVGCGLDKVGHKKALRFIRKCRLDFPLSVHTAAMDELISWSRAAACGNFDLLQETKREVDRCCSRCHHTGSKRNHQKNGCEVCGTAPGDLCFDVSSDEKFRESLRKKALTLNPPFNPSPTIKNYMCPNDSQLPVQLANLTSDTLEMRPPQLNALASLRMIIKGRELAASREYVIEAVARLLSRGELLFGVANCDVGPSQMRLSREKPVPEQITKRFTHNNTPCYEILWKVSSAVTDENGEGLHGFEYTSVEPRSIFDARFSDVLPRLLASFEKEEKERQKQGDAQQTRRRHFLDNLLKEQELGACLPVKLTRQATKKRNEYFQSVRPDPSALAAIHNKKPRQEKSDIQASDDVRMLCMRIVNDKTSVQVKQASPGFSNSTSCKKDVPPRIYETIDHGAISLLTQPAVWEPDLGLERVSVANFLSPESPIICHMGGLDIEITPLVSKRRHKS